MTKIMDGAAHYISPQDYIQKDVKKNVVPEESQNVKSVIELAKEEGGLGLSKMIDKHSLRNDYSRAVSAEQNRKANIEGQPTAASVKLSTAGVGDSNKAERLAGAAASVLPAQTNITQSNNKSAEVKSTLDSAGSSSSSAAGQIRSQPAVEGGTDITGTESVKPAFINVVGPMNQLELNNTLTRVLVEGEKTANESAAKAISRFIDSTARGAQKGIDAANERLMGQIVGGITAGIAQTGLAAGSINALRKENVSLNTNVRAARNQEFGVANHKTAVGNAGDSLVQQGKRIDPKVKDTMSHPHAGEELSAAQKHVNHSQVQNNTNKARIVTDLGNQIANTTRNVTAGAYDVDAARMQAEGDLARADATVHTELSNTNQQVSKKTAETRAALNQANEAVLNTNNSTASAIAERMR